MEPQATGAGPRPITSKSHHDQILKLLAELPRGRLLDVPTGEGALAVRIRDLGFEVETCDIDPAMYKAPGPPPRRGNLNDKLPFETAEFDVLVSVSGLHRIFGVDRAISEFSRVLKPGGRAIVSFPNYGNIARRRKFFAYGSVSTMINTQQCRQVSDLPEAHFRNMLLLPQVCLSLRRNRMQIRRVTSTKRERSLIEFLPFALLARAMAFVSARRSKLDMLQLQYTNDWSVLCGGAYVILLIEKEPQ